MVSKYISAENNLRRIEYPPKYISSKVTQNSLKKEYLSTRILGGMKFIAMILICMKFMSISNSHKFTIFSQYVWSDLNTTKIVFDNNLKLIILNPHIFEWVKNRFN